MNVLVKKLWRTIWRTKGQFLAVAAVVTVGIAVYIAMNTAYYNLDRSKELFYRENNFADYYFHVVKAPQAVVKQVEAVPGVAAATGRLQKDVPVLKEGGGRATARLVSYPLPMAGCVNRLHLLAGQMFTGHPRSGAVEVLVDPQYAKANGLRFNDEITVVAEGRRVSLTVVGTATSPEFVYPMKDAASLVPEPETFGIVMLPLNQAQQILHMPGQINQVVIKLAPGADEEKVAEQVESLLEPYGNLASYPRKRQLSHAVLQAELDGLLTTSRTLPVLFLGIAAAIQFIMLGRMVKAQRLQIGIMKALGYGNRQIIMHYAGYALAVSAAGALLGSLLGLVLASTISQTYARYFNLPEAIGGVNARALWYGLVLSVSVGLLAGLTAARGVMAVNPAESMRPEPPRGAGQTVLEHWGALWRRLGPAWKMTLRAVARNRLRFGVTLVGTVFAVGMLVVSMFANDAIDYILQRHFYREQSYDYLVRFTAPVKESELLNIARLEGVYKAEPLLEIPVKMHFRNRERDDVLVGLSPGAALKTVTGVDGRPLALPGEGMLVSSRTAQKLGLRVEDRVTVETLLGIGPARRAEVKVLGVSRQLVGDASYVSLDLANRVLRERGLVSGVMLRVDPGRAAGVEQALNDMTAVSSVLSRRQELENFQQNLDSMIYFTAVMVAFAVVLGFAIVYNSSVIGFAERRRELALLRVLGFTGREVSGLVWRESLLQAVLGVALGLPAGYLMVLGYARAISSELYSLPAVVYPATYLLAALGGLLFVAGASLLATRGVSRLDMVDVLKNRD